MGEDGDVLEGDSSAEGARPPSSCCRPSVPSCKRSPSLPALHAAASCTPLLPAALDASEDEEEGALLAEILTASSAYFNPQVLLSLFGMRLCIPLTVLADLWLRCPVKRMTASEVGRLDFAQTDVKLVAGHERST